MFQCLAKITNYSGKDKGPDRVRDCKTARNRILLKLIQDSQFLYSRITWSSKNLLGDFHSVSLGEAGSAPIVPSALYLPVSWPLVSPPACASFLPHGTPRLLYHDVRETEALARQGTSSGPHSAELHSVQMVEQIHLHTAKQISGFIFDLCSHPTTSWCVTLTMMLGTLVSSMKQKQISTHWAVWGCEFIYCNYHSGWYLPSWFLSPFKQSGNAQSPSCCFFHTDTRITPPIFFPQTPTMWSNESCCFSLSSLFPIPFS